MLCFFSEFIFFSLVSQLIHCKSLGDFLCLVSWVDKIFHCTKLGSTELSQLGVTDFDCPKEFSIKFSLSFSAPAPLNDSYPLLASRATQWLDVFLKDQTHLINNLEVPSWKLMSKGERGIHQSLSLSIQNKRCTLQEERMLHVSKRGETWLVCSLVVLVFSPYLLPISNVRFRGRGSSLRRDNYFFWGHVCFKEVFT